MKKEKGQTGRPGRNQAVQINLMNALNPQRITAIWKCNAAHFQLHKARRSDIRKNIKKNETECKKTIHTHLAPWIYCLDEALLFFNNLNDWTWEMQGETPNKLRVTPSLLIGRSCTLAAAVRLLIVSGFEDPARIVSRTLLENIDLILAALVDDSVNEEYFREKNPIDETEFWKKHVAYNRIDKYLRKVGECAGMDKKQMESWLNGRAEIKKTLSASTHVANFAAMRSCLVPSLVWPSMLYRSAFGHHSLHSPRLALNVAESIWQFGGIFMRLLTSNNPPVAFTHQDGNLKFPDFQSMFASFFTLQQLLTEEELPPFPEFVDDDEANADIKKYEPQFSPVIEQREFELKFDETKPQK